MAIATPTSNAFLQKVMEEGLKNQIKARLTDLYMAEAQKFIDQAVKEAIADIETQSAIFLNHMDFERQMKIIIEDRREKKNV